MNCLSICFITDEGYVLPTMTAIKSVIMNKADTSSLDIYVIGTGLKEQTVSDFQNLKGENTNLTVLNIENEYEKIDTTHPWVSKAALLKFSLPNLFSPPRLNKLLYLDGDMLIQQDLSDLFNTDISNVYAAVVADMAGMVREKHHIKLGHEKYFNSGMMLLNLEKMRSDNISAKLLANKNNDTFKHFMDQDTLNQTFAEKVIWLSPKYNLMQANLNYSEQEIADFYHLSLKEVEDILKNPIILHLTSIKKPWKTYEAVNFKEWYKYLKELPPSQHKQDYLKKLRFLKIQKDIQGIRRFFFEKVKKPNGEKKVYIFGIKVLSYKKKIKDQYNICNLSSINKNDMDKNFPFKGYGVTGATIPPRLIVSLTSYPERMVDIHYCLYSLLNQSHKPDMLILWLGEEQFPNKEQDIPKAVLDLQENGLTIKWHKNIKAYTKLIPTLKEYPEDIIVTADDDIFYPNDWLEKLYSAYIQDKSMIHCHRAHYLTLTDGKLLPYNQWQKDISNVIPSYFNFFTGVGGVLYPSSRCLYKDILNEEAFSQLSPYNDDIWFWAMAVLQGTKINVVENNITYINPNRELAINGTTALSHINVAQNKNDKQIAAVLKAYPEIKEKLTKCIPPKTP